MASRLLYMYKGHDAMLNYLNLVELFVISKVWTYHLPGPFVSLTMLMGCTVMPEMKKDLSVSLLQPAFILSLTS